MSSESSPFVHLHNHFSGSTSDSILKLDEAIGVAKDRRQVALAITDHGKLSAIWPFYFHCLERGITPLLGCELYFLPESSRPSPVAHLVVLARDLPGLFNLVRLSSWSWERNFSPPDYGLVDWNMLERFRDGLIVLSACISGPIGLALRRHQTARAQEHFDRLEEIFGDDFYPEVSGHNLKEQPRLNRFIADQCRRHHKIPVVTNDCHYLAAADWRAHDIFVKTADKYPSDFAYSARCFYLKDDREMAGLGFPPAWLNKTREIAEKTTVHVELDGYLKPGSPAPAEKAVRRSLPVVRPLCLGPAAALRTAGRVLNSESRKLHILAGLADGRETLEECSRGSREFRALIDTEPELWREAQKLEGVVREFIPDFRRWVDLDAKMARLIPIRLINGEPAADIEEGMLAKLGVEARAAAAEEEAAGVDFTDGYASWWDDDYDDVIDKLGRIGIIRRDVYFLLGDSCLRRGRRKQAVIFLELFLRSGDISFHRGFPRLAREYLERLRDQG